MSRTSAKTKPASIKDVAALAQVSVPTVSRYLNNRERVSEEKQDRIAKAIDLLDYRPSPIARALVSERTKSVTVLSTNITLYGQSETLHGIEQRVRESGYTLNISVLSGSGREELRGNVQRALDQNPAGVILLNYDEISSDSYAFLPPDLPVVMTPATDIRMSRSCPCRRTLAVMTSPGTCCHWGTPLLFISRFRAAVEGIAVSTAGGGRYPKRGYMRRRPSTRGGTPIADVRLGVAWGRIRR